MLSKYKNLFLLLFIGYTIMMVFPIAPALALETPYDVGAPITGLGDIAANIKICGVLKTTIDKWSNNSDDKLTVFNDIYKYQCISKDKNNEKSIYARVSPLTRRTAEGRSCVNIQDSFMKQISAKKTLATEIKQTFLSQCLKDQPVKQKDPNTQTINEPIKLSAPIPVEGGDVIEASNKGYLFVYMIKMYRFVISIAGIIAVIELIFAGFQIGMAAGDTGKVENGKKRLIQTLEGLGILFTSAIILNTLNPVGYNFDTNMTILSADKILSINSINSDLEWAENDPNYKLDDGWVKAQEEDYYKEWIKQYVPNLEKLKDSIGESKLVNIYEHDKLKELVNCEYKEKPNGSKCAIQPAAVNSLINIATFFQNNSKGGVKLKINSAYRSLDHQAYLYYCYKTLRCSNQKAMAAYPGNSSHNTGWALDVGVDWKEGNPHRRWETNFPDEIQKGDLTDDLENMLMIRKAFYTQGFISRTLSQDVSSIWQRFCNSKSEERWHFDYNLQGRNVEKFVQRSGCKGDIPKGIEIHYENIGK